LHQVAAGSVLPDFASVPLAKVFAGKRLAFRQATVTGFDLAEHKVKTTQGPIGYDVLVLALGGEVDYFDLPIPRIPGLREHAVGIQTMQQANHAQTRLQDVLYRYAKGYREGAEPLTLVIGGGGMTGVEIAGQLADEVHDWRKEYRLPKEAVRVVLVEAQDRILPGIHPEIAEYATAVLQKRGVTVWVKTIIARVERDRLTLGSGETVGMDMMIWAGGVRGPSVIADSALKLDSKGRVIVNGYLQAEGHETVYALGDCALCLHPHTGQPSPPSARMALNQGKWLARFLAGEWTFPFDPHTTGAVISLGQGAAVAVVGRLRFYGRIAYWLKSLISLK
ncbi:MAG: NAD(P)/FAD-dependent oxidoreductase, partial [Nitrospirales bacterium]